MRIEYLIQAARGQKKADLVLVNARVVNVFSGRIIPANIAICQGHVAGFGDYAADEIVDLGGRYVCSGFVDAHVHIESAMTSVTEFSRAVVCRGTTAAVADPHEIANVLGIAGIEYMIDSSRGQPADLFFTLPSCVPATDMETAGAALSAEDLGELMGHEKIVALAEMMNFPGVIFQIPEVLAKIKLARSCRKPVDGHSPRLSGKDLSAYLAAGIFSDHECTEIEEAREKLEAGMHIMIREGTGAMNLETLLPLVTEKTAHRMMWCTDDRHPHDLIEKGHIDSMIRLAVRQGLDPVTAIQMGTLNPARYFNLPRTGAVAPGYRADLVVFSDLNNIQAERVFFEGKTIAENGKMLPEVKRPLTVALPASMNVSDAIDFSLPAPAGPVRVIELVPDQVLTRQCVEMPRVENGRIIADTRRDLLKLAVVERHRGSGNIGKALVRGFGLKRGALASSVAHDSHNIIVAGANDADMRAAVDAVVRMKGGLAAACDGRIIESLALPIAGLMSDEPVENIRNRLDALLAAARSLGAKPSDPFMMLSFLALPVIPELKLTDKGLVDVNAFRIVPLTAP